MIDAKCVGKMRNWRGEIEMYDLVDGDGNCIKTSAFGLKQAISNGTLRVSNLTLTSDNRLIDSSRGKNEPVKTVKTAARKNADIIMSYWKAVTKIFVDAANDVGSVEAVANTNVENGIINRQEVTGVAVTGSGTQIKFRFFLDEVNHMFLIEAVGKIVGIGGGATGLSYDDPLRKRLERLNIKKRIDVKYTKTELWYIKRKINAWTSTVSKLVV